MAASAEVASEDPEVGGGRVEPSAAAPQDVEVAAEPGLLAASAGGDLEAGIHLGDVAWVPAGMFPVALLLLLAITRRRGA